ncbi:MAG TPA: glycosyltransferase [Thermoanaerobaculia bacterium]|jgi:glycosyltransferase involved in cell wall biosynthesis
MTEVIERVRLRIERKTAPGSTPLPPPRVRTAIAVIMTRFPAIDETFILREINELERAGQPVLVVPLLHGDTKVVHEEAKPWVKRALYTSFLSPAILLSNLLMFFRNPKGYLKLLMTLIGGTFFRPSTLIRTLALFPKSVHLARILPQRGIRHVHSHFATHATTMAYIIASLSDITYSFTVHGPDVFVHRMLLAEKIAKAKFIRSISTFNKAFLCGLYPVLTDGKIEVVHSGVNPEVYARAAEEASEETPREQPARKPQILSVAALSPSRGFPFLVDACARLLKGGIDAECKIVGAGKLRAVTEAWIVEHGMADRVKLLGLQPQHEVARLMGECDIFVLPSIIALDGQMDGIPLSLMEAMAAGKPVIASGISGIPELVKHNVNGILVDAAHPQRVAQAIRTLINDPQLRDRLGRAGQLKIRNEFDIRRIAERLVALFDRYTSMSDEQATAAQRIARLTWARLQTVALGVRRVHERGHSYVAEVTITDGIAKREVIVRQHRDIDAESSPLERARHEFEVLSTLRQSMSPEAPDTTNGVAFTVPRVMMFDEPHAALVVERADGTSLAGHLSSRRSDRYAGPLRKAGAWLRAMQEQTRSDDDGRHVLTAIILLAMRDLDLAAFADRSLRRMHGDIVEALRSLEATLAERPMVAVGQHGDFHPEHIFIGERRVDVIDFGCYREGLPLEDVAQLLMHLELRFRGRKLDKATHAFLEGYAGATDPDALRLFRITKALELLAHGTHGDGLAAARQRGILRKIISRSIR